MWHIALKVPSKKPSPSQRRTRTPIEWTIILLIAFVLTCDLLELASDQCLREPLIWRPPLGDQLAFFDCGKQSLRNHDNDNLIGTVNGQACCCYRCKSATRRETAPCWQAERTINGRLARPQSHALARFLSGNNNHRQPNESQENELAGCSDDALILMIQFGQRLSSSSSSPPKNQQNAEKFAGCKQLTAPVGPHDCRNRRAPSRWSLVQPAEAIRLVRLEAPRSVQSGQPIRLRCIYETKGDKLQSLSWCRNGREFYRFQPFERRQPVLAFNMTGIQVDLSRSRNNTVFLVNTTIETSGRYKCEATGSTFQEANLETYIEVIPASSSNAGLNHPHLVAIMMILVVTPFIAYQNLARHWRVD